MNNLFEKACDLMPGGVNSPVRAFGAVGNKPLFIKKAEGAKLTAEDGREYIDLMMSWGPLIFGHARPEILEAIKETASSGLTFGACHEKEIILAELIREAMPHVEMIRMVNSGTEATMSAIRLARAATGRKKIIKFSGCYHGHADPFLISAGSGALTHGTPSSPGVPAEAAQNTLLAEFNDIHSVSKTLAANSDQVACIIVEPVAGNMGVIPPIKSFLQSLRELCDKNNILLIFDEVITGFRLGYGGATEMFGVTPDLVTLGKIIGGGLPAGAYGGRKGLMEKISPLGGVYQAGTLSGNPLVCAAGIATLELLKKENPYPDLDQKTAKFISATVENLKNCTFDWSINRAGSLFTLFFGVKQARTYENVNKADTVTFAKYFQGMLKEGIYLPPSQFEANFLSTAHTWDILEQILEAQKKVLANL